MAKAYYRISGQNAECGAHIKNCQLALCSWYNRSNWTFNNWIVSFRMESFGQWNGMCVNRNNYKLNCVCRFDAVAALSRQWIWSIVVDAAATFYCWITNGLRACLCLWFVWCDATTKANEILNAGCEINGAPVRRVRICASTDKCTSSCTAYRQSHTCASFPAIHKNNPISHLSCRFHMKSYHFEFSMFTAATYAGHRNFQCRTHTRWRETERNSFIHKFEKRWRTQAKRFISARCGDSMYGRLTLNTPISSSSLASPLSSTTSYNRSAYDNL